jgi:KaiC/GvpD/RAD55 family RecA-like ATPase
MGRPPKLLMDGGRLSSDIIAAYKAGEVELSELTEQQTSLLLGSWEADVMGGFGSSRLRASPSRTFSYPPKWLVHGLIPSEGIGQIYGASGSGKTYLALDLALSIANVGVINWFGHRVRRHGDVVYCALEGTWSLQNRIQAWLQANSGTDARLFTFEEEELDLTNPLSVQRLADDIKEANFLYRELNPALIVIDTQRLAMSGDENTENATSLVRHCIALSNDFGCCVLLVHHEGYDDTHARGSTVIKDAVAFQMHLKKDKKKAGVNGEIFLEKNKYGLTPPETEALAAYQVTYTGLKPWNELAHDFDSDFVRDEYGEIVQDGYCTEVPLQTKTAKVIAAMNDTAKGLKRDTEIVRELIEGMDLHEASTGYIRKVLGGNSPVSKQRITALIDNGIITVKRREGLTVFYELSC